MTQHIPPPPDRRRPATASALARDAFGREIVTGPPAESHAPSLGEDQQSAPKEKATDALGRRAGALSDEIDFPAFVASLVHGTFDAIVDSSIRQMESFADLVSAVSKPLEEFTQDNVTPGQARAWLVEQFPQDVTLVEEAGRYTLAPLVAPGEEEARSPGWLADFGQEGNELSDELLEETLLPQARERVARQRLSTLSTMVLLGMQRVVVKDGSVGARLRFRAAAADRAAVQYATSNDPGTGGSTWAARGQAAAVTKVSTVGINAQSDSELKAELFGDVKINFASETLPLERFVDEARRTLLERHSRQAVGPRAAGPAPVAVPPAPAVAPGPSVAPGPEVVPAPVAAPVPAVAPAPAVPARPGGSA